MRSKVGTLALSVLLGGALAAARPKAAMAQTSVEILHGWGYNRDFNGDRERTILTLRTFQQWPYGTFFLSFDMTGPFTPPDAKVVPNEKGGFNGGIAVNVSMKKVGRKITGAGEWRWGALRDVLVSVQVENTPRFGALNYLGAVFDLEIPLFDYAVTSALIRQDWSLRGVDLQLGGAWQITVPLGKVTDLVFLGFVAWGLFGEGEGVITVGPDEQGRYSTVPVRGRPFFISQPQLLLDAGKLTTLVKGTIYAGIEYQLAWNRYLQQGVTEHVPQIMLKWVI